MQGSLKKSLPHYIFLLFISGTVLIWFYAFPIDKNAFDIVDIVFEGIYLVASVACYYFITKLDIRMLQLGWAILCYALLIDFMDEFTRTPIFWNTIFQGILESLGIILIAVGFCHALRKTRTELEVIQSARNKLDHIAHHDNLTGLPNRILFSDRLQQAMASAKRDDELLAVHFIDLDNFKDINDTLGHHCGDLLLKETAHRLRTCIRDVDTVARWGGDEFSVIQTNLNVIADAEIVAGKIIEVLSKKFELDRTELQITVSIGIAFYPLDTIDFNELLKIADKSMYRAKRTTGSAFEIFDNSEN
ncbi:MAG: GGDEF domain-containing protein [Gammaproteobacteria bacterium]